MRINFVTSNLAPFRVDWLDEIANYADVNIFYNDNIVKDVNQEYIKRRPIRAKYSLISKKVFKNVKIYDFHEIFNSKADLTILDGYGFLSQILLILLLRLKRKKFVLSVDGGFITKSEIKLKYRLKKFLISSATYYLSTSEATDNFLMYYGAKKEQIYRHYFTSLFKKDIQDSVISSTEKGKIRKELEIEDKITIIGVGKFIYGKGFDILLKSLKYINYDVNVLIVGGKETNEYRQIIKSEKVNNVKFVDFCDKDLLNKYYDASDIFVLPTRSDVWGLVINEAFARGLPVITTDMCIAGKSLIENNENGFVIPINNEKMLANYINELSSDKSIRVQMGRNNINKIKKYTIEEATKLDISNFFKMTKGEE